MNTHTTKIQFDAQVKTTDLSLATQQHLSTRSTKGFIAYVRQNLGEESLKLLFNGVLEPDTLISKQYTFAGQPIDIHFFDSTDNWYNNTINLTLFTNLRRLECDLFHVGNFVVHQASQIHNTAITGIIYILGPSKTFARANEVNALWNRTKDIERIDQTNTTATAHLRYRPGFTHNNEVSQYNLGIYHSILDLVGFEGLESKILEDEFSLDGGRTQFQVRWKKGDWWLRLRIQAGRLISKLFSRSYLGSRLGVIEVGKPLADGFEHEMQEKIHALEQSSRHYQTLIQERLKQQKKLEQLVELRTAELAHSNELLEEQISARQEFFSFASHELRTPLMVLDNALSGISQREHEGLERKQLKLAHKSTAQLSLLAEQLLNYEKASHLWQDQEKSYQQIGPCINAGLEAIRNGLGKKRKWSIKHQQPDKWLHVSNFDLRLLLDNLISNAVKFTLAGEHISVYSEANDKTLTLRIKDEGAGLGPDSAAKVFDKFYRSPEHQKIPGSGLGLAIVQRVVNKYQGQIELKSKPSQGTQVTLSLPIVAHGYQAPAISEKQDIAPVTQSSSAALLANQQRATMLIFEDNLDLCQQIADHLQSDYLCITAHDGETGMSKALAIQPNIIISDLMMPHCDGKGFLKTLRAHSDTASIPFIVISAHAEAQSELYQLGATDFLVKPFSGDILKAKIELLLKVNEYRPKAKPKQQEFIVRLDKIIESLYSDSELNIESIAEKMHLGQRQLQRSVKEATEHSPKEYLNGYRIDKACELLRSSNSPIQSVASAVGFASVSRFSSAFKKQRGLSPSQYRKQ